MRFLLKLAVCLAFLSPIPLHSQTEVRLNGSIYTVPNHPYLSFQARQFLGSFTTSGSNGLANAMAQCAGAGCQVLADASDTNSTVPYEFGNTGDNMRFRSYLYPSQTLVQDRRGGRDYNYSANPPNATEGHVFFTSNTVANATGQMNVNTGFYHNCVADGSYNYGSETTCHNLYVRILAAGKGISQNVSAICDFAGIGDHSCGGYYYHNTRGGAQNGDDEGDVGLSLHVSDGNDGGYVQFGTITAMGASANTFQMSNAGLIGSGRYAIRAKTSSGSSAALYSLHVTGSSNPAQDASSFGTLTVTETVPVSSAIARANAYTVARNNDVPQDTVLTFPSFYLGTAFRVGPVCVMGAYRNERATITSVSAPSGGSQTIHANLRYAPNGASQYTSQAWFFQDAAGSGVTGLCQTFGRLAGFDRGIGSQSQDIPLMGATDANHVVYSANLHNGQGAIPGIGQVGPFTNTVQMTRTSNVAHIDFPAFNPSYFVNNSTVTISGATDSSFNGPALITYNGATNQIQWPNSGANVSSPVTGTITAGAGRNVLNVYGGAEVTSVADLLSAQTGVGSYFAVEPGSTVPFAVGETVDFPNHYSEFMSLETGYLSGALPSDSGNDKLLNFQCAGVTLCDSSVVGLSVRNNNPFSSYRGYGGYLYGGIQGIDISGPASEGISLDDPTQGAVGLNMGCAGDNCNDPQAAVTPLFVGANGTFFSINVDQYHGTLCLAVANNCRFSLSATGSGNSGQPLHSVGAGATGTDAANVGQLPLALSVTTTAATSDTFTLAGMTSSGHCSIDPTSSAAISATQAGVTAKATNSITITHAATAGLTYDVLCTTY